MKAHIAISVLSFLLVCLTTAARWQGAAAEFNPAVQGMVEYVSGDSLWEYIAQLSGEEPLPSAFGSEILNTRYSLGDQIDLAAEFLKTKLESYGLNVEYDPYVVGQAAFYAADFVDYVTGWVVANDGAVYGTADGGRSWSRYRVTATYNSLWGISFVNHDRGWVCGTGGGIYRTDDGGITWNIQAAPLGVTLRDICFADSLNGWVVGDGGQIFQTGDGGTEWLRVESGTTADLYGVEIGSSMRAWACGRGGTILFWDGRAWTAQGADTEEDLMDVAFGDGDTGWIVGRGGTILGTSNGGGDWSHQAVPEGVSPFLNGVAVAGRDAWAVGLNGTMLVTHDGGGTWTSLPTGTLFGLTGIWVDSSMRGWCVGYGSTVLYTDDGTSWESMREYLPGEAVISLKNVVAGLPGTESDEEIIVCGHFDSISEDPLNRAPGADDNASGTAAVIETARVLSGRRFERTLKFICFSGEEQGLFGSGEYAAEAAARHDDITAVVNFDMIGYTDALPEEIDIVGNPESEWLADLAVECANTYIPSLGATAIIDPTMVLSDHASFWKAGYSAILATEDLDISYPYYHTTADTLGNLNRAFLTGVVRLGVALTARLAEPDTVVPGPGAGRDIRITGAQPNPFRTATDIRFSTGREGEVDVGIVDVQGKRIATLVSGRLDAGPHVAFWDGCNRRGDRAAPGIYFVTVGLADAREAHKVVLLR